MNKPSHLAMWDSMRMRHGLTLRLIDQIPADKLEVHPIPNMRNAKELLVHMYACVSAFPQSALTGTVSSPDEKALGAGIATKEQLITFVQQHWALGDKAAQDVTDAQLAGMVTTPWGAQYPGAVMFHLLSDEYLHHRGQLYVFLRAFGVEPVMNWDFDHNAAEFQPKQHA